MTDYTFHLTALDVRKQEFRKVMRGYDPLAVEDFRTRVADELERVVRERADLAERVRVAEEQLVRYREREAAMNDALVAAQQLRAATREQAEREAQLVLREADADAERRRDAARREVERLEASAESLARLHQAYLASLRVLVERQRAELEALAEAAPPLPSQVAGTITPAAEGESERGQGARRASPRWIKSLVEE